MSDFPFLVLAVFGLPLLVTRGLCRLLEWDRDRRIAILERWQAAKRREVLEQVYVDGLQTGTSAVVIETESGDYAALHTPVYGGMN